MDMAQINSLSDLNKIHHEIEELFERHQLAVLDRRLPEAQSLFDSYEKALLAHMKEEDEILLPLYEQRAGRQRGGAPENFTGEHRKILEWLGRLRLRITRIPPGKAGGKTLLALLDDEAPFKKFMEHHSARENLILYPELERVTTEREKAVFRRLLTFTLSSLEGFEEKKPVRTADP